MTSKLPISIAAAMVGTVAILVLTVGVAVAWMTQAMDDQSRRHSDERVRTALFNVLEQTRTLTLDYAKWKEAADAVAAEDADWLHNNIGNSVVVGEIAQIAVVWGGPFAQDVGWIAGEPDAQAGLLEPQVLGLADHGLAGVPLGAYRGITFFTRRHGEVYALAAARIEPSADGVDLGLEDRDLGRIVMGRRLDAELMSGVGKSVLLDGIEIVRSKPSGEPSLPLMSGDARPVGYLTWTTDLAGTALLHRMFPTLALVTALAAGLVLITMMLLRRGARHLVRAEQHSSIAARTDALTGLPNRAAFNAALAAPAQAGERAVLFLDVNDFKRINDSIGHEAGDQVIIYVAQRMAKITGPDYFLARISGDEFVFVVIGAEAERRTKELADLVLGVLVDPFSVLGHHMQISMAMGYAVQATADLMGNDLVRQADLAMYEAKRHKGQMRPVAFSAVIEQASRDAQVIERGLRQALARPGEFSIAYQPIVSRHGRMERAEALARWTSPELGIVPPDRFIAVAEQAGLIVELGRKLFLLICDDLMAHPDLHVSINISTLQLMAPDFIPSIVGELRSRCIDPNRIEIELTEAVVVDNADLAVQRLEELHAAGFSIALDDFGTGYSSVGYLEQFRFDTLKIDRSFVSRIRGSAKGVAVIDGMIRMAHGLDLRVVCEGVEAAEDVDLLRELGADLLQGYHLDRPLPIQAIADRWLRQTLIPAVAA